MLYQRRCEGVSLTKLHLDLQALRSFFTCAIAQGWRESNPTDGLRIKRRETPPEAPYDPAEINAVTGALTLERDRLIALMFARTGLRIAELCGLYCEDIDWHSGMVLVRGKGGQDRYIAPPHWLMARLRLFTGKREVGPLFYSEQGRPLTPKCFRQNLAAAAARVGIKHVHPHRFRVTFAVEMLNRSGGDLQAVQYLLGHKSIQSTIRYTEWSKAERGLSLMREAASETAAG